jgi:DNA-3-methyladenine glycosylase
MIFKKLDKSFYVRDDTVKIARELLGKYLITNIDDRGVTGGKIVETEAYLGAIDKASHGYDNKKTERNKNLYKEGGYSYVYFIYGMYYLFNVVTGKENFADAVLIRAIEPEIGTDIMLERRNKKNAKRITSGPGLLTIALGINLKHNGIPICEQNILKNNKDIKDGGLEIWLEDRNINIGEGLIISTPRIGVDYAAEHAKLPYRFKIKDNKWASR